MQKIETLGCIQSVDLRDCWEYEDKDFTPWLAQEDTAVALSSHESTKNFICKIDDLILAI